MHDLINLIQVLTPIITGLFTLFLSSVKNKQDRIDEENDRLSKRVQTLTSRVEYLEAENDRLRRELLKNDN
ncbi:hypothetical protein C5L33_000662 [Lactobacillus pasteurii]|nr:hypothetical protein C5L33_000662 [Lactobacillus pasteurii]